nr:oligosaccharide flippase family protein [Pyrinomonadaceae bacterium]
MSEPREIEILDARSIEVNLANLTKSAEQTKEVKASEVDESYSLTARALWVLAGRTLSFMFGFALPLLLVRRLSQTDFGLYKQVFLFVATSIMILPLGFHMSAFYFLPRESRQPQIVLNILLFHLVVAGVACASLIAYPSILRTIFNSEDMVVYSRLIAFVILTWITSSFMEYVMIAHQEVKLAAILTTVANLTKSIFLLGATIVFGSVRSLIWAAIIQGLLQTVILLVYLRSRFNRFWRSFEWPVMRMQLSYALPFGFASMLVWAQSDMHNYFVSYHFGPSAYAIYSIGCFQIPLITILAESVGFVMVPRVSYLQKSGNTREIAELIARMVRKLAVPYFPLFVFLLLTGREFITVFFTRQYLSSWPVFAVYLTMIPLSIVVNAYDPVMRAYAEHRFFLLKFRAFLLVLLFGALWVGTARMGMVGVIMMVVGVGLIERLVMTHKMVSILGVAWRDLAALKDIGKLAGAAVSAGIVTAAVRQLVLGTRPFIVLSICGVV